MFHSLCKNKKNTPIFYTKTGTFTAVKIAVYCIDMSTQCKTSYLARQPMRYSGGGVGSEGGPIT